MRYRKLDASGSRVFGGGQSSFWINQPEAVAQAILTRLRLLQGSWFLDITAGVPWATQILGKGTTSTYDAVLRAAILGTEGVNSMISYSSSLVGRSLTVNATVDTIYGAVTVSEPL